jgi:hypothetical protein
MSSRMPAMKHVSLVTEQRGSVTNYQQRKRKFCHAGKAAVIAQIVYIRRLTLNRQEE